MLEISPDSPASGARFVGRHGWGEKLTDVIKAFGAGTKPGRQATPIYYDTIAGKMQLRRKDNKPIKKRRSMPPNYVLSDDLS